MSIDRPTSKHSLPRLALAIPDAGSSGIVDASDLRAEPLVPSLAAALASSRVASPSKPRPAPRRRPSAWPRLVLRTTLALAVLLGGASAVLRLAPEPATLRERVLDGQLSMHEASTSPTVMAAREGNGPRLPRGAAPARATGERMLSRGHGLAAAASEAPTIPVESPAPVEPAPGPAATAEAAHEPPPKASRSPGRTARASARKPVTAEPSAEASTGGSGSISARCVLDPRSCDGPVPEARPVEVPSADPQPAPLPDKLSTAQLKSALATTKAEARECGPAYGAEPGATVRVRLSIEGTTGLVLSATPQGEHAEGSLGRCVARALEKTSFPRFTAPRMGTISSVRL